MFLHSGSAQEVARRRLFLRRMVRFPWLVGVGLVCAIVLIAPRPGSSKAVEDRPLLALGTRTFPGLTTAERALLVFADKNRLARFASGISSGSLGAHTRFAIAGISADPFDPSNDPAHSAEWSNDRDIRAGLIRWLAVDNVANTLVDANGVRVLGARI